MDTTTAAPLASCAPRSCADLFWSFTWLALQGFGGVLAVAQRELVERKRWLTPQDFLDDWAVAQIMPGPNVVNLSLMVGHRYFGLRGALAALAGMLTVPLLVVLAAAVVYAQVASNPQVVGALRGMGGVTAGMIGASAIKLLAGVRGNVLGWRWCAVLMGLAFVATAVLRWPLPAVLPLLGGLGFWLAYRRLG